MSASDATPRYDVVIPTVGRPSLARLLDVLAADDGPPPERVVVVDDRASGPDLVVHREGLDVVAVRGGAAGPAAARNAGWRRCSAPWVVFVDDDVVLRPEWRHALVEDLRDAAPTVAAVQGRVHVPLERDRPPSDQERNVAQLATAAWITADMAVRREALAAIGGFDERFRRAYREDTDLALRLMDAGHELRVGRRAVDHPVRPSSWWVSVPAQRGNADDALMARLHGPDWRERGQAPAGLLRRHVATTLTGVTALGALLARRRGVAAAAGGLWALQVRRFWSLRRNRGRGHALESAQLLVTSAAIPPAATWWAAAGRLRARRLAPRGQVDRWSAARPELVLFDRDGTLVHDVAYNGDPDAVVPVPGARAALDRLRAEGVAVGLITNQSGVARGMIRPDQVRAVNERVASLLGPFATVQVCEHGPEDGCERRKPSPGMVLAAAEELGVRPERCAVVGDIGSDVQAGLAAGAEAVLVPTPVTRPEEVAAAPSVAADIQEAVEVLLSGRTGRERTVRA
jgi:HAD superfamily hydrolase (TIGR01662 family)